jgi:hypothetical protein
MTTLRTDEEHEFARLHCRVTDLGEAITWEVTKAVEIG